MKKQIFLIHNQPEIGFNKKVNKKSNSTSFLQNAYFHNMKKKAITKQIVVNNKAFISTIKQSVTERTNTHKAVAMAAINKGIVQTLQKNAKRVLVAVK